MKTELATWRIETTCRYLNWISTQVQCNTKPDYLLEGAGPADLLARIQNEGVCVYQEILYSC
jgi:hypothetical protein